MADLTRGTSHNVLRYTGNPLDVMFAPRSAAVIGASDREGSIGHTVLRNLLDGEYKGAVYPVNPLYNEVSGLPSFANIREVPGHVDLAVIATPAKPVREIVRDCAAKGVKVCIVLSAGFKEVGPEGAALELAVVSEARQGNVRLLGPNCIGVMNPYADFNATFAARMALKGSVGFASQSGALFTAILDWSIRENVGFSSFVCTGSMADIDWGDLIYYFGDDPRTKSILIYMETIGDARSFMSAAREVALTKPIIVIKPGQSAEAARAASAHTGANTGDDVAINAAFRRCGVLRVETIAELFLLAEVMAKQPRPPGPRLTIVTNAGGPAVSATDALIRSGGQLASLSPEVKLSLDAMLPAHWSQNNPIDLLGDANAERYHQVFRLLAKDKNSDGLLAILTPQAMTEPAKTAEALRAVYDRPAGYPYGKPVLASWMGGHDVARGTEILNEANIPTFDFPDTAARLFTYMWRYQKRLRSLYETPYLPTTADEASLKRFFTGELIAEVRESGRVLLTDYESKQILQAYGIPTIEEVLVQSQAEAAARAEQIGYPLILRAYTTDETLYDVAGQAQQVVQEADQLATAYAAAAAAFEELNEGAFAEGIVLRAMLEEDNGYALQLASYPDSQLGPVLCFGLGGDIGRRVSDTDVGLPPLNSTLARRMLEHTAVYQAMRKDDRIDILALESLLVGFSHLVVQQRWIKEIRIDPLLVTPDQRVVRQARIQLYGLEVDESMLPRFAIRPYPTQYVQAFVNRDGIEFVIRPIRPEDEPLLVDFHARLSEESVYLRYFRAFELSERVEHERLTRLCFIDYDRTIALVIIWHDPDTDEQTLVAVGRLTRSPDPVEAEYAILVRDDFQGKGLGTVLLQRLIQIGRDEGLERIIAYMLPTNTGMINVSKKLGFRLEREEDLLKAVIEL